MHKELYLKPHIQSEELEPGALGGYGSPDGPSNSKSWLPNFETPCFGFCCNG